MGLGLKHTNPKPYLLTACLLQSTLSFILSQRHTNPKPYIPEEVIAATPAAAAAGAANPPDEVPERAQACP